MHREWDTAGRNAARLCFLFSLVTVVMAAGCGRSEVGDGSDPVAQVSDDVQALQSSEVDGDGGNQLITDEPQDVDDDDPSEVVASASAVKGDSSSLGEADGDSAAGAEVADDSSDDAVDDEAEEDDDDDGPATSESTTTTKRTTTTEPTTTTKKPTTTTSTTVTTTTTMPAGPLVMSFGTSGTQIFGDVTAGGVPVNDVVVDLFEAPTPYDRGEYLESTTSGVDGNWSFASLPADCYIMVGVAPDGSTFVDGSAWFQRHVCNNS